MNKLERIQLIRESFLRINECSSSRKEPRLQIKEVGDTAIHLDGYIEYQKDRKTFSDYLTADEI